MHLFDVIMGKAKCVWRYLVCALPLSYVYSSTVCELWDLGLLALHFLGSRVHGRGVSEYFLSAWMNRTRAEVAAAAIAHGGLCMCQFCVEPVWAR